MGNFSKGYTINWSLIIFALLTVRISLINCQMLQIKPEGPILRKAVNEELFVVCKLEGADQSVQQPVLRWLTPNNITVTKEIINVNGMTMQLEEWPESQYVLVIQKLQQIGAGTYTCLTEIGSKKLSESIEIKPFVKLTWQDAPYEQYPTLNKDYKVKCRVIADPAPYVDWLKNEDKIITNDHYIIEADGLVIKNAQETDDGVYTCRAYIADTGSMVKRNIKVEVHVKPSFNNSESSRIQDVVEGETVDILCNAFGKPKPVYSWIKSNRKTDLGTIGDRFSVDENTGRLTINHVKSEDNGELICEARNAAGIDSQSVRLTVLVKPHIYELKNITVATGKTAKLECHATGNPLPIIMFRKLSLSKEFMAGSQPEDNRIIFEQKKDEMKREIVGTLIINNLQRSDDGLYACFAKNKGGEAIKNGHLMVQFAPSFDNTPMKEAWSWDKKPVNLTCLAESIPNATISWRFNNKMIDGSPYFKQFGSGPESTLLVTPSVPDYYGNYKCEAKNTIGISSHTIRLTEAHPPGGVSDSKRLVATATTITFTLSPPSDSGGRPIKAYVAQYKQERQSWAEAKNKTWSFDSPYILENLIPQTIYNFRFAGVNEVGMGQFASDFSYTMPKRSFPEEPMILSNLANKNYFITSPYSNRFEVRWKVPADNGEPIDFYDLKYCLARKSEDGEWEKDEESCIDKRFFGLTSLELTELRPDQFYMIELRAHNIIGYSTPGKAYFKTAHGIETSTYTGEPAMSSAFMILILVISLIVILIIIDLSCFCFYKQGIFWWICGKGSRNTQEEVTKVGSEGKELLHNGDKESKIVIETNAPIIDNRFKKDSIVQYDGRRVTSTAGPGFTGKDSAV